MRQVDTGMRQVPRCCVITCSAPWWKLVAMASVLLRSSSAAVSALQSPCRRSDTPAMRSAPWWPASASLVATVTTLSTFMLPFWGVTRVLLGKRHGNGDKQANKQATHHAVGREVLVLRLEVQGMLVVLTHRR